MDTSMSWVRFIIVLAIGYVGYMWFINHHAKKMVEKVKPFILKMLVDERAIPILSSDLIQRFESWKWERYIIISALEELEREGLIVFDQFIIITIEGIKQSNYEGTW